MNGQRKRLENTQKQHLAGPLHLAGYKRVCSLLPSLSSRPIPVQCYVPEKQPVAQHA